MIHLSEAQLRPLLNMDAAIAQVERAFVARGRGLAFDVPRQRTRLPGAHLNIMQGASIELGLLGFKAYYVLPHERTSYIQLIDRVSGKMLAILDAYWISQVRTGAATGVAAKFLARHDARTVGMFGSGWQARAQLEAVCQVRSIDKVKVYSRNRGHLEAFCSEMTTILKVAVQPADSPRDAVAGSDIVITITRGGGPVFDGAWLEPGQFIAAAGVNALEKRELDTQTVMRADLVVADARETARLESGDLLPAIETGQLHWDRVADMADVAAGSHAGRRNPDDVVLFESHGLALQDIYCGAYILERARELGIGTPLPIGAP